MARLNSVIGALETGQHAFASFVAPDPAAALEFATTDYDGLVFEAEHKPWDVPALRDSLQYLLDRRRIFDATSVAPSVTPLVRIPANGGEKSQWHAKQALDLGAYGIVWPHISRVDEAYNAVAACRYPRLPDRPRFEPAGLRGDSPAAAARYWGVTNAEYYAKSDVWPLDPNGEILVALMIEDQLGIENLPDILDQVPGIGLVVVGEGDMSQELGVPRQYDHPRMLECKRRILDVCAARGVAVGHPHVTADNVKQVLADGYRFLMTMPVRGYPGLELGRTLTGRD
ncbi:HpcH/HpaI aldolase family protein [Actinophytocola oryzae]|uniref:4-hydroxy-2-oxoheptanedioate aldolase n=1 Tax=Actinophytocola oryzae TaxID=502181 RepID=A0A4R7VYG1_9PSEU|nr:aldolase/citrate lyase family protein [Actinophytocola oryzae]TDV54257.1 4-hydroxy-2-oxoheptanedioate aldolase [Actinophytocola oryzae]